MVSDHVFWLLKAWSEGDGFAFARLNEILGHTNPGSWDPAWNLVRHLHSTLFTEIIGAALAVDHVVEVVQALTWLRGPRG